MHERDAIERLKRGDITGLELLIREYQLRCIEPRNVLGVGSGEIVGLGLMDAVLVGIALGTDVRSRAT